MGGPSQKMDTVAKEKGVYKPAFGLSVVTPNFPFPFPLLDAISIPKIGAVPSPPLLHLPRGAKSKETRSGRRILFLGPPI